MMNSLAEIDQMRIEVSNGLDPESKARLGQFFTPVSIAQYMASLFPRGGKQNAYLLDAGAGIGTLTLAFLKRWEARKFAFKKIDITVYEIDKTLHKHLHRSLNPYVDCSNSNATVVEKDFLEDAAKSIAFRDTPKYTHVILNPPYKKISSDSRHRQLLHQVGIETVNLYSAFVALSLALMQKHGYMVAIIPRSFCNGPYYRSFRQYLFSKAAIKHIHLFLSRDRAFKDDNVLQENVIIMLERSGIQGRVTVSTSTDAMFHDYHHHQYPFSQIVNPDDSEQFISIPTNGNAARVKLPSAFSYTLADIGVDVSTGPVVDFRMDQYISAMPSTNTIPLLYPCHFNGQQVEWPKEECRKPNALILSNETKKWAFPAGFYTVTKRFSSKEEKRRIVACVVDPSTFSSQSIGFENHLNVYHNSKRGLSEFIARGLAVYLNSSLIDICFREFSGHTQVNVTDLKQIKYPSKTTLESLGQWAKRHATLSQEQIDKKIESII